MRAPRLPILPEEAPLREPPEYPPPDPPRAFAKETVGTPIRDNTRHAAMTLVVFKLDILSIDDRMNRERSIILPAMTEENLRFVLWMGLIAWWLVSCKMAWHHSCHSLASGTSRTSS